jgi:AcrR family transcriptional regulator
MRARILDEVERLIACKGVCGFRLRDVGEPLGVQVPAIHKHYKSRDDVLVVVSRRFIALLAEQFQAPTELAPRAALRFALNRFVELKIHHPAYTRLALVDFATPGGMDYVKLASMHARLRALLRSAGFGTSPAAGSRSDASEYARYP